MGRRGPIARISLQVDPRRGRLCPREAMLDVATHQFRQLEFQSLRADLGAALHRPGANDPDNGPRQHVEPLRRHPGQVGAIDGYFLSAKEVRDHLDRAGQLRRALGYPATENAASPERRDNARPAPRDAREGSGDKTCARWLAVAIEERRESICDWPWAGCSPSRCGLRPATYSIGVVAFVGVQAFTIGKEFESAVPSA